MRMTAVASLPASIVLLLAAAAIVVGEDPPATPPGPSAPGPEVHKIYVPYKDLQKVFEKEGQGVFVPYAEFRALWEKAYRLPDDPTRPPLPAAVRSAVYAGVAEGEGIRFTATVEVEVLAAGWQRVALDFGGVGIESATIGGEPALLVPTEKGYDLLLNGAGRRTLDLVFRVGAPLQGETHVATITLPPVPLARLSLRVPGTDTDVQATPRLAGSTGPTADGATELLAYLGPVSTVQLSWRRRPDDADRPAPLVFAAETTDVLVDRGVARTSFVAEIAILRAPLDALTLVVPADAVVLYVEGNGIRTWERNAAGDRIQVALREPVKEKWSLRVGLERAVKDLPAEVALPLVGIEGLERETGFLRLRTADGVKVDPRATPGLVQTDLSALPDPLKGAVPGKAFSWRHAGRLGAVTAAVEALVPRVSASVGNRVGLRPEGIEVRVVGEVSVERAGIFAVEFDLPASLEVTDVQVKGAELDDWTRNPGAGGAEILRVALRDRLLGNATILVFGRVPLAVPEEDGKEATIDVPFLRVRDAQHVRGYLAVHADAALDRRETARVGATGRAAAPPAGGEPPALPGVALPLSARFEHREGPASLSLAVKRKAATVTGSVETGLRLEPDRTRLEVRLVWQVQFRGVDAFRFRGPADLVGRVHLGPKQAGMDLLDPVPEAKPEGAPADWKPARATWTLRLAAPRQGRVDVALVVDDRPETPLAAGESRRVAVPVFFPVGPDGKPLPNSTLHAAVRRDPLLEVAAEAVEHGEEIDARELAGVTALAAPETFLAFRSYDPEHAVTLRVTKHEYEPVAEVVVSHVHLNTVIPAEGRATTEAFLVVRNNDRQYLELRLPGDANIRAVSVDGKPETPRRGEDGAVRVPLLANLGKDQAFVVALAFDHEVERSGFFFESVRVSSPVPLRVTSDLLTWRVYVPKEREITAFGGDLRRVDDRGSWALRLLDDATGFLRRKPAGTPIDLSRMVHDLEKGSPFQVQADGTAHLFANRTGTGSVSLTSVDPAAFLFLRLLLLAGAFLGARLFARALARRGRGTSVAFAAPALLLLVLLVPAGPGMAAVLTAMAVGVLLSGVLSLVLFVVRSRGWGRGRAPRAPAAPPAPPPPPPPPAPPPPGGGGGVDTDSSRARSCRSPRGRSSGPVAPRAAIPRRSLPSRRRLPRSRPSSTCPRTRWRSSCARRGGRSCCATTSTAPSSTPRAPEHRARRPGSPRTSCACRATGRST